MREPSRQPIHPPEAVGRGTLKDIAGLDREKQHPDTSVFVRATLEPRWKERLKLQMPEMPKTPETQDDAQEQPAGHEQELDEGNEFVSPTNARQFSST